MFPRQPATQPRILSTFDTWSAIPGWGERVDSIRLHSVAAARRGWLARVLHGLYDGVKLWWLSRGYHAVVTDSSPPVAVFGLLERLRLGKQRRHLMLECLWTHPPTSLHAIAKRLQFRASLTRHSRAIVYARRERQRFSAHFGIPAQRFVFIPYHTTLRHFTHPSGCALPAEKYVFAGGDTHRDYPTLCKAVAGLNVRVVIAARDRSAFQDIQVPPNVEIITTDPGGFLHLMLHAYINVVPLQEGTLRSAGQQTFLNAMALGTAVIVTDVEGGSDYVDNWVNGVLVEAGNAPALRAALVRLLNDPDLVARISAAASRVRSRYATEKILSHCLDFLISDQFADGSCAEYPGDHDL